MRKPVPIIVAVLTVVLAVGVAVVAYKRSDTIGAKLAKMDNGVSRRDGAPPNTFPVQLWAVRKANLDGIHGASICDIGLSRLACLKKEPIDDATSFGLDLPIAGDASKKGREWGGNFSYSYANGEVECQFFDTPFRVSSQGVVQIAGETYHLNSK
ncbi:MAG: hypothetical protein AB8G99_02325, partial [Planctomycetaceae bacterium]